MSVTIEQDLKEYLARFEQKLDKLDEKIDKLDNKFEQKFDNLAKEVNDLKVGQAEIKTNLQGIEKRLENQEFISRGVLIGLIRPMRKSKKVIVLKT